MCAAVSGDTARINGRSAASSTVTGTPRLRAIAANSSPMNPAPTTTADEAEPRACCRASASASVRSPCTPGRSVPGTGRLRLAAPVASTRCE